MKVNISNFSVKTAKRQNFEILDIHEYLYELPEPSVLVSLQHSMLVWISFDLIVSTFLFS